MKQTISIDVPKGKKVIYVDNKIKIVPEDKYWKGITTIEDAIKYAVEFSNGYQIKYQLDNTPLGSYIEKIATCQLIVIALTNDNPILCTDKGAWYPMVYMEEHNKSIKRGCIGTISIGPKEIDIIIGKPQYLETNKLPLLNVCAFPSKEIAEHFSKYFGDLLFEIMYDDINYIWVKLNK